MTSTHVPLISALKMTFRMTFKTWVYGGIFKKDFEVELEGVLKWDSKGDFKQDIEGDLLSSPGQVQSGSVYSSNFILLSLTLKEDDLFTFQGYIFSGNCLKSSLKDTFKRSFSLRGAMPSRGLFSHRPAAAVSVHLTPRLGARPPEGEYPAPAPWLCDFLPPAVLTVTHHSSLSIIIFITVNIKIVVNYIIHFVFISCHFCCCSDNRSCC